MTKQIKFRINESNKGLYTVEFLQEPTVKPPFMGFTFEADGEGEWVYLRNAYGVRTTEEYREVLITYEDKTQLNKNCVSWFTSYDDAYNAALDYSDSLIPISWEIVDEVTVTYD